MSGITLAVNLAISIAIILFLVLKFKINPVISMILASLYMGISCSLGFMDTITSINSGFGSLMTGIGFPIGFGIMMGQILEDSGAAESLAKSILKAFPGKKAPWALGLTAFLLSIPVFFDVTFVILIPLGIAVAKETKQPLAYFAGAIAIGGVSSQTFVPPTPNPLAAATILDFDLSYIIIAGTIVGLAAAVFSMFVWFRMLDRPGFWDPNKDETGLLDMDAAVVHRVDLPSPWAAVIPICLPVLAILIGSFWPVVTGSDAPVVIQFISQKTIAILLGLLAAYIILLKRMGWSGLNESVSKSLKQAGVVLLITGAGGAFGAVIQATNIGEVLIAGLTEGQSSTMLILCLTFGIGVLFRVAQGSGTVASITAMTIMASVAPSAGCHPVYIALAALAGGNFIGHVNDSGFWVVTNLSGASVTGGLKTYTWNTITLAGMAFILSLVGATVLPMV
ncbi:GntP family permease [Enterocloster bolteae]|uniref:GntP family permease n=2 Tax=Enterocloster bolteae TaxID=208479 RepID=A0A414AXI0_9FIRM|nr:GntP family permease [Enterocloster bolteae]